VITHCARPLPLGGTFVTNAHSIIISAVLIKGFQGLLKVVLRQLLTEGRRECPALQSRSPEDPLRPFNGLLNAGTNLLDCRVLIPTLYSLEFSFLSSTAVVTRDAAERPVGIDRGAASRLHGVYLRFLGGPGVRVLRSPLRNSLIPRL